MEISDTKIATGAIVIVVAVLTTASYLSGAISETLALGLASAAIGAIAGLAGFDAGKKAV
jgi:hypothetical protein